jgi:hypothetical protein
VASVYSGFCAQAHTLVVEQCCPQQMCENRERLKVPRSLTESVASHHPRTSTAFQLSALPNYKETLCGVLVLFANIRMGGQKSSTVPGFLSPTAALPVVPLVGKSSQDIQSFPLLFSHPTHLWS